MEKRERLERMFAGDAVDRVPVALWRPFPGDDQRTADFATAVIDFQLRYDWDLCVIVPQWGFAGTDYGLQDVWKGDPNGVRDVIRYPVRRSLDWTDIRASDPTRGEFGRTAEVVKTVCDGLSTAGIPVALGVLSPLAQAARLSGNETLLRHMRTRPDRLLTGLATLTESTLRFLDSIRNCGLSGVDLCIEHADFDTLSEPEYEAFGLPGDIAVLSGTPKNCWIKLAYFRGNSPMPRMFSKLQANVVGWDDRAGETDLSAGRTVWSGAVCGGLDAERHMRAGTPTSVRDAVREAIQTLEGRRLIVGCGRPMPVTVPHGNLRAARTAVERMSVA